MPTQSKTQQEKATAALVRAIRCVVAHYLASGAFSHARDINAGHCTDFVHAVYEELGGSVAADAMGITDVDVQGFLVGGEEGDAFDRELLATHWPQVRPP